MLGLGWGRNSKQFWAMCVSRVQTGQEGSRAVTSDDVESVDVDMRDAQEAPGYQLFCSNKEVFNPSNFIIRLPKGARSNSMVSSSEALRRGDASNPVWSAASRCWNELAQWLAENGLHSAEGAIQRANVGSVEQLRRDFREADIRKLPIEDHQKRTLLRLCPGAVGHHLRPSTATTDAAQATSSDACMTLDSPGDLSDASTDPRRDSEAGSDSEAEELSECVACLHVGDPDDFAAHLDELLGKFIRAGSGRASEGLSFCSLLLVAFMRVGAQNAGDDFLDADLRGKWMECIQGASCGSEEVVMKCFVGCLGSREDCEHRLTTVLRTRPHEFTRRRDQHREACGVHGDEPRFAAVYVVDLLVRKYLRKKSWEIQVVRDWYRGSEPAAAFFQRANDFLAAHVSEYTSALGEAVKIGSYCALLGTSRLAALLLFEHLAESKLQHKAAGAAGPPPCFAGFRLLVGSSGAVVSAEPGALPSRAALANALEGLRTVAGLPRADLALLASSYEQLASSDPARKRGRGKALAETSETCESALETIDHVDPQETEAPFWACVANQEEFASERSLGSKRAKVDLSADAQALKPKRPRTRTAERNRKLEGRPPDDLDGRLNAAVEGGHVAEVERLIEARADLETLDKVSAACRPPHTA
jgi:hypothetical protein